jgi:hypothetical protein
MIGVGSASDMDALFGRYPTRRPRATLSLLATEEVAYMPQLRRPPTHGRALVVALIILAAGCGTSAPEPGSPHATTSSAITVYTLAESGSGKPGEISHGKPMDIDWDAASGSFFVSTYNDGTIYRGRLNDPNVPVYIEGTLDQMTEGITVARGLLYTAGGTSGQIRVYNLVTKAQVGHFETGSGGELIDLAVTDTGRCLGDRRNPPGALASHTATGRRRQRNTARTAGHPRGHLQPLAQ